MLAECITEKKNKELYLIKKKQDQATNIKKKYSN